jgi:hypothetical protein
MKALAIALIALAISASAVPAAGEKIVPASEFKFARLLLGCWSTSMWNADFLDGTEASGNSTICFRSGARLSVSYDEYRGTKDGTKHTNLKETGTYKFGNDRLQLSYNGKSETWLFPREQMDCDAVIRPNDELRFQNCKTDNIDEADWTFIFAREAE